MRSKTLALQVIVMGYSMFGIIGISSQLFSPSPITFFIGSALTLFSYSCISVLSKKLTFRDLFNILIPLNIINIVKSYSELGVMYLKYKGMYDQLGDYATVVLEGTKNNVTLTNEYINEQMGSDIFRFNISNSNPLVQKMDQITNFIGNLPTWIYVTLLIILIFYSMSDFIIGFISNIFLYVSMPILYVITAVTVVLFDKNPMLIHWIPSLWIPIASTVDSFLRIYILRSLFFRFMKDHPLIKTYMEAKPNA